MSLLYELTRVVIDNLHVTAVGVCDTADLCFTLYAHGVIKIVLELKLYLNYYHYYIIKIGGTVSKRL